MLSFKIIGEITQREVIAVGRSIREIQRLGKVYGADRWRKFKGIATVRLAGGSIVKAELHWYEAHGIGKKELKIKRLVE